MDSLDHKLVAALRHNGRASFSDLAVQLGVTRSTVRARVSRLEQRGDVIGYTAILPSDTPEDPVRGLMMIGIEGRGTERILRHLYGIPAVRTMHTTNGRWDVIVEIGTSTLEMFDKVLSQIRSIDGIARSETSLLLSTRKSG